MSADLTKKMTAFNKKLVSDTPLISTMKRVASDISLTSIDEESSKITMLSPEEKASMHIMSHPMDHHSIHYTFDDTKTNILWEGIIFENIQSLRHFKDSKSFVDHVLKTNDLHTVHEHFSNHILNSLILPPQTTHNIKSSQSVIDFKQVFASKGADDNNDQMPDSKQNQMAPSRASYHNGFEVKYHSKLDEFMKSYFFNPGFELLAGQIPLDWNESPKSPLFEKILVAKDTNTQKLRQFAKKLNHLWKILYREVNKNVNDQPFRYSFITLKHPQIFVPGGRFREVYYWDSLWIIQGLLSCKMIESAMQIVENLSDLVLRYGFVPNGTRKYYMDRSQPPLLSLMVMEIYTVSQNNKWLQSILPALSKEHKYWTSEPVQVLISSKGQKNFKKFKLARYYSSSSSPRPESYYEVCSQYFLLLSSCFHHGT